MRKKHLHNRHSLKEKRQTLRNNLTPAEARLWIELRNKKLKGRKFRRQHFIGPFIVDFFCPGEKLVIELDGEGHNYTVQGEYDDDRDRYLQSLGYVVLRIENKRVFEQLDRVLQQIENHFKK